MTEAKRRAVQEIVYALLHSLMLSKEELSHEVPQEVLGSIGVEYLVVGFGSQSMELPSRFQHQQELAKRNQIVLEIGSIDLGGTRDAPALEMARNFFTQEDIKGIKEERVLGVVIEITDGHTETATESSVLVEEINRQGIFCRGIQIAEEGYSSSEITGGTFKEVWKNYGIQIPDLASLPKIIRTLLREAIQKTQK